MRSIILAALLVSSCCIFHANCKDGSAGKCATDEVQAQFPHLLPLVADILIHHGVDANVEAELAKEGITVAKDILDCVMQAIFAQSSKQLAAVASGTPKAPAAWIKYDDCAALQKASQAWLKRHGH